MNNFTVNSLMFLTLFEIVLVINACAVISGLNSNRTALEYSNFRMHCKFYCNGAKSLYAGYWTRGNIKIVDQSGVNISTKCTNTTEGTVIKTYLNISSVRKTDEGEYRCLLHDVKSDLNIESSDGCVVSVQEVPSTAFPIITVLNLDYNTTKATCITERTNPPAKLYWLDQLVPMQVVHNKTHISIEVVIKTKLYVEIICIMYVDGENNPRVRNTILGNGSSNGLFRDEVEQPLSPTEEVYLTSTKEIDNEVGCFNDDVSPNSLNDSLITEFRNITIVLLTVTLIFPLLSIGQFVVVFRLTRQRKYPTLTATNENLL